MKMRPEHYEKLEAAIRVAAEGHETLENYIAPGLGAKRYRWDLLWVASRGGALNGLFKELYSYLNDAHIDTALRRITNTGR